MGPAPPPDPLRRLTSFPIHSSSHVPQVSTRTTSSIHAPKMGPSGNRLTQIDMLALTGTKTAKVAERAVLYDPAPKGDALSKKGTRSLPDISDATAGTVMAQSTTVRSATSGAAQLRTTWGSPWARYEKIYDIELVAPWKWLFGRCLRLSSPSERSRRRMLRRRFICSDTFGIVISLLRLTLSEVRMASTLPSNTCRSLLSGSYDPQLTPMSDSSQLFSDRWVRPARFRSQILSHS